jgi:aminoglycoside phosphotransferase (APT) family kinase protein
MADEQTPNPRAASDATSERVLRATLDTTRDRDSASVRVGLQSWLHTQCPGAVVTDVATPAQSGASSELYFVTLENATFDDTPVRHAVLRLAPSYPVYPVVDLRAQFRCMDLAARRSSAPVPRVYAAENDERVIGAPFLLMQRVSGRGAPDWPSYVREGWIHDLSVHERATLCANGIAAIAAVHRTELTREACRDLTLPVSAATLLDQSLAYWRRYLGFVSAGGDYPVLDEAVAWLEQHRPAVELTPRLVWGDASLRNMLFEGLEPCALLDFEFSHVGIAAFDIAFYALMDYVMAEGFAGGAPRLSGFFGVQRTIDHYESITGWSVPARDYFARMAVTYMSLATTRVFQRLAREGRVPHETVAANPPLAILGRILETGRLPD